MLNFALKTKRWLVGDFGLDAAIGAPKMCPISYDEPEIELFLPDVPWGIIECILAINA